LVDYEDWVSRVMREKIDYKPIKLKIIKSLEFFPEKTSSVISTLGQNIKIEMVVDVSSGKWQKKVNFKKFSIFLI
jgi:hypothetical protein